MDEIISAIRRGDPEEIAEKIDVPSFAKFYLLNEFLKTFDFDMSSVFFYYQNGKLYAGPAVGVRHVPRQRNRELFLDSCRSRRPDRRFCRE